MSTAKSALIAPSLLSADFSQIGSELKSVEGGGADWHHLDVMDGHFVPNLTFGLPVLKAIKAITTVPIDVHLMITNPDQMALAYADAGADYVSFHVEAAQHHDRLIAALQQKGVKAGVAINPGTSLSLLDPLYDRVDYILVMSVNPGFGGQSFIEKSVDRITQVRAKLNAVGRPEVLIQVDGGINDLTAQQVVAAGADVLVAGSYVYGGENRGERIASLKGKADD